MEILPLKYKQPLYLNNQPIEYVYFRKQGVVSFLTIMGYGSAVEVGTVGNEGMVGLSVLLAANSIPG